MAGSSLLCSLDRKVGLLIGTTTEAQLMVDHRGRLGRASLKLRVHFGAEREGKGSACLTPVPVQCAVPGQGVGEGSCLLSCFSCSSGMQTLVLLLWTGALLGHGSSQNVPDSSQVSRVGWWDSSSPSSFSAASRRQHRKAALGPGWALAFMLLGLGYFGSKTRISSLSFQDLEKLPLYRGSRGRVVSHKGRGSWAY